MEPTKTTTRTMTGHLDAIQSLVRGIVELGRFELSFEVRKGTPAEQGAETPEFVIDFFGPDADLLLEKNGLLLDALEHLVFKAARLDEEFFGKITFDSKDWRRLRARELQLIAQVAAERVIETGDPFALNPMSPRERRIIHLALKNQSRVRTASDGFGPERKVVILPA